MLIIIVEKESSIIINIKGDALLELKQYDLTISMYDEAIKLDREKS